MGAGRAAWDTGTAFTQHHAHQAFAPSQLAAGHRCARQHSHTPGENRGESDPSPALRWQLSLRNGSFARSSSLVDFRGHRRRADRRAEEQRADCVTPIDQTDRLAGDIRGQLRDEWHPRRSAADKHCGGGLIAECEDLSERSRQSRTQTRSGEFLDILSMDIDVARAGGDGRGYLIGQAFARSTAHGPQTFGRCRLGQPAADKFDQLIIDVVTTPREFDAVGVHQAVVIAVHQRCCRGFRSHPKPQGTSIGGRLGRTVSEEKFCLGVHRWACAGAAQHGREQIMAVWAPGVRGEDEHAPAGQRTIDCFGERIADDLRRSPACWIVQDGYGVTKAGEHVERWTDYVFTNAAAVMDN